MYYFSPFFLILFFFPLDLSFGFFQGLGCVKASEIEIEYLKAHVIAQFPHDSTSFTQGLAIEGQYLYESTGLYGKSTIQKLDLSKCKVLQSKSLHRHVFGEGVAAFSDVLIQITWREQKAFVYDRKTLNLLYQIPYEDEGWGLCRDGETIWMSNGSSCLTQRNAKTFAILRVLPVTLNGQPLDCLNDLECVGDYLYSNVWLTDWIVRIHKQTGKVDGKIDASQLLSLSQKKKVGREGVLNGIAFYSEHKTFFLTGKNWPFIFEVRFAP